MVKDCVRIKLLKNSTSPASAIRNGIFSPFGLLLIGTGRLQAERPCGCNQYWP
jgi:hypothetical protein